MGKSIWDTVEIRRLADMRSYVHKIIKIDIHPLPSIRGTCKMWQQ